MSALRDNNSESEYSDERYPDEVCGTVADAELEGYIGKRDPSLVGGNQADDGSVDGQGDSPLRSGTKASWCGARLVSRFMPAGGYLAGIFNLAGSSLGAGILALPSAFNTTGVIMGTFYLIIIFLLTVFSVGLLAKTAIKTGIRSYEGMGRGLLGKGGDLFCAIIMFVKCIGACIAYVICVSNLWEAFLKDDRVTGYYRSKSFRRILTSITFIFLMLPLSLPKQINSLRYVSLIGVSFILYFVVCVIIHSSVDGIDTRDMEMFQSGNDAIKGLGMYMFAYLCQSNMFEIWNEMKPKPTVRKMEIECFVGMSICTCLYWLTGFFGYSDFGTKVQASLLTMYEPLQDYYFAVAYVGLVVKFCVAFALHILPCRDAVHHVIGWDLWTIEWWKNAVLCIILSGISLICGLFIPNVNMVFGLLGSFTGGFIAFVFPAIFYMYSGGFELRKVGWYNYFGTFLLLICGVIIICFGTTSTIYGIL